MRLYYVAEFEGSVHHVSSALGVDGERWNDFYQMVLDWRLDLQEHCAVPAERAINVGTLLEGRGRLAHCCGVDRNLTPEHGAAIFRDGLRVIERAARDVGGVEVINVCLPKRNFKDYEWVGLDRLLNRINTSVAAAGRNAFLIFDEDRKEMVTRLYARLKSHNPVPSKYEAWEDGNRMKDIPIGRVIGGPVFKSSASDYLLQMAGLIPFALLSQEESSSIVEESETANAFGILESALNRNASRSDPHGVVRR